MKLCQNRFVASTQFAIFKADCSYTKSCFQNELLYNK